MVARETPTMGAAAYQNSSYGAQALMGSAAFISNSARAQGAQAEDWHAHIPPHELQALQDEAHRRRERAHFFTDTQAEEEAAMPARRIVQVYIADPSDAVPLADAILYTGEQKMTDLTDQELFFEIDIKGILETHNAKRTKVIDKKIKDRTEYLEPAKVRDLKMVVVTVASF